MDKCARCEIGYEDEHMNLHPNGFKLCDDCLKKYSKLHLLTLHLFLDKTHDAKLDKTILILEKYLNLDPSCASALKKLMEITGMLE